MQEKQLTTLGKNIHALEVDGNFDDCQQMVKQAFADDRDQTKNYFLLRLIQSMLPAGCRSSFIIFLHRNNGRIKNIHLSFMFPVEISEIFVRYSCTCSGLPVQHFIAACNANDVVPEFLKTENYQTKKTIATISNAMDVGDPSNFVSILEIFEQEFHELKISYQHTVFLMMKQEKRSKKFIRRTIIY